MSREDIRKKWKNGQSGISENTFQNKLGNLRLNSIDRTMQMLRDRSIPTIQNQTNPILNSQKNNRQLTDAELEKISKMDRQKGLMLATQLTGNKNLRENAIQIEVFKKYQQNKELTDKINQGSKLATGEYFLRELGETASNSVMNIATAMKNTNNPLKDTAQQKEVIKNQELFQQRRDDINSSLVKTLGEGFGGIGNMLPQIVMGLVAPRFWRTYCWNVNIC